MEGIWRLKTTGYVREITPEGFSFLWELITICDQFGVALW